MVSTSTASPDHRRRHRQPRAGTVSVPCPEPLDRRRLQPHEIKDFYGAGQEDATRTEPFTVDTDEPPVLLGDNLAPTTVEYVLHALAACVTGTIAYHAAARGIAVDGLETTIQGDLDLHGFLGLDSNVRPGYEQVQVTIKATGDFDDDQLAELASLARFSPVRDIVSNPVPVAIDVTRA